MSPTTPQRVPNAQQLSVCALTDALFAHFDPSDAETWDNIGLIVGDPNAYVSRVGVALDATFETLERACDAGCQALITHHPVALTFNFPLTPRTSGATHPSDAIYHAIEHHIALIAMHTNLDRSVAASTALPGLFNLRPTHTLEAENQAPAQGRLGQVCIGDPRTPTDIAQTIKQLYGVTCRAFYAPNTNAQTSHNRIALCSGSFPSSLTHAVIQARATMLITGEIGYHTACDLQSAGVTSIIMGHDTSELIYSKTLTKALLTIEGAQLEIVDCDAGVRWHTV